MSPAKIKTLLNPLADSFGRVHDYLRISLTDRCNLRCIYCMPPSVCYYPSGHLMQPEEIAAIAGVFVNDFGIRKIRLTGGEPLMRHDAALIMQMLARLPVELAITTNGVFLHRFLDVFQQVGLRSINISLDSLQQQRFSMITQRDVFKTVRENIDAALSRGFYIKVNAVMMKGVNEDELNEFVAWTKDVPLHVRFIEFMPFEGNRWQRHRVMTYKEIFSRITERFPVEKLSDHFNSTSKSYRVKGYAGTFAIISSVSQPFCDTCNRLRLTADGKLRNCLFSRTEWDLLTAMRNKEDIRPRILEAVRAKAFRQGGSLFDSRCAESSRPARAMVKIGG